MMECNKEEAIRAKEIAENKMKSNDFAVARKFALKAQQLYQELENISQMITVCDVHCSAESKLFGNEMDWYGLLQIELTANEATIKKQYRKFALQLHPDKNKFPGAETAFKLIGEAQRVLLDKDKRSLYDMKYKVSVRRPTASYPPQQKPTFPNVGTQNNFRSTFTGMNFQHQMPQQSAQTGVFTGSPTFWTMCPFCNVRYQYYRKVINKSILCQTCSKPFVAYESGEQSIPMASNFARPAFHQQKEVPSQRACRVEQVFKGNSATANSKMASPQKTGCGSDFGKEKVNGKRGRKQVVESSESCSSESSSDSEVDVAVDDNGDFKSGENFGHNTDQNLRRSGRQKQQVSYKENMSDDDDDLVCNPKKLKRSGSFCATENENASREQVPKFHKQSGSAAAVNEEQIKAKQEDSSHSRKILSNSKEDAEEATGKRTVEENGYEKSSGGHGDGDKKKSEAIGDFTVDSGSGSEETPESYVYPDPDFNDFDNNRKEECFMVGQMWALYDDLDAMPRFYARIRRVSPSGFKLRITWLEPDPDDEKEVEWVARGLPFSCGKFKHGKSENTENRLMFSHLVSWEKGSRRDTCKICPRKGEVWGLFQSWDFNWISDVDANRKYDYEFVEILSAYIEGVGISVAYLAKVKGFASVFCRKSKEAADLVQIPPAELFRFSHSVPSFKLSGEEREGVPIGAFELDPASLPLNLEEIAGHEILKEEADGAYSNCPLGSFDKEKSRMGSEGCTSLQQDEEEICLEPESNWSSEDIERHSGPPDSTPEAIEIPDPEFYNFDAEKSEDKLQVGQIWSLYSDEDGLPKYYGQIVKIQSGADFKLFLRWLESCLLPNNTIRWHEKGIPICCGTFKFRRGKLEEYCNTVSFSHRVSAEPGSRKSEFTIFPRNGEIWSMYKNWDAGMKRSDLENCEYDIVEVIEAHDSHIEVLFLERVAGFNSVFKPKKEESAAMKVSLVEVLRFSHQIPAFKLTEERDGSLRGCWELDPAALPVRYFSHLNRSSN